MLIVKFSTRHFAKQFVCHGIIPVMLVNPILTVEASAPNINHDKPQEITSTATISQPLSVESASATDFETQQCEAEILNQVNGVGFQYDAEIRSVSVQSERTITSTNSGLWQMHSKAHWLFISIEETSVFTMPSWQLQHFEHKRKGMGQGKDLAIVVDHQNHSFVSETHKKDRTFDFKDDLYYPLNYQLRLQLDVD